jgi:hypothetical protein
MSFCLAILLALSPDTEITLDQIKALTKVYLRDSAEVPLNVAVTTVVTDVSGKQKHQGHLTASMIFRGYSLQSGKFSVQATKGGLTPFGLQDSLGGDLAAFLGGTLLFRKDQANIELKQATETGKPLIVIVRQQNCPALESMPKMLVQPHPCGIAEITVVSGEGGELAFQHVHFESTGRPASAKVTHWGDVQLKSFRYDVDFQLKILPGEAKPYLWPLKTVVSATSDKGTITITNQYSAKPVR